MGVETRLDVTGRDADFAAVKLARDCFGRLDVIVNNAGYGQFGMVEEISESEIRAQLETNLLGALWVTQAALPYLREQGRFPGRRATGYRQRYERARCRHRRGGGP